ncbi:MAG TPA: M28 family peptidase, partial [Acidobacteriota bacterium]|nr:M28 family peptidase [Acidobacteriota bacterium]HNT18081.1 M28 family peptidase [Acidobacteriota bacterium]
MSVRDNKLRFLATVMFLTFLCVLACPAYDLLIRVERRGQDDKKLLMEKGLSVTAEVSGSVFVLGGDEELAILGKRGFACEVIDSFPELSDYYLVGVRDDSDIKAVHAAGTVIYSEENLLLLRVPSGMELASLHDAKVFVSPFGKDPIREPLFKDAKLERKESLLSAPIPLVQKMVGEVSTATIDSYWETLVNNLPEGTRNSTSQGCYDASAYVLGVFDDLGLKTRSLPHTSGHAPNSEGEITGAIHPSVIYLIEGHLDDMPSSGPAPGADDNASGSVAVMEAARVLSCYPFKNTVRFLTVTGEEYGLYGSTDYANDAYSAGENIQGVLNFDMPGWAGNGSPNPEDLDLNYNSESEGLGEFFADCATTYSTGLAVDAFLCPSLTASDHYGFWQKGYKAVCGITDNEGYCGHSGSYPYYHTANDTIANCGNKNFFYSVVRTGVAALAELGEPFRITFDKSSYSCGGNLQVIVGDRDLNMSSSSQQTFSIGIRSTVETEPETLVLTEDGADSMIFRGNVTLTGNPPAHGDGFLSVGPGSFIEADYVDAVDCGGALNVSYSASAAACTPPVISNVRVTSVTGDSAVVEWTTSVPATSRVTYGTSIPPSLVKEDASTLATEHSLLLSPLSGCSLYYFSVTSVDEGGNSATDDNGGFYHSFSTPTRVYAFGPDTVESGTGIWTASGGG